MLKIALHIARKDYEMRATKQASGIAAKQAEDRAIPRSERAYKGRKADTPMPRS
jgi:hypothetical protein